MWKIMQSFFFERLMRDRELVAVNLFVMCNIICEMLFGTKLLAYSRCGGERSQAFTNLSGIMLI